MKPIDEDDDTPAPFVKIRQHRKLYSHAIMLASFEASCKGKIPFNSAAQAAKALRYKTDIDGRRVYRCRHCQKFHIGSPGKGSD